MEPLAPTSSRDVAIPPVAPASSVVLSTEDRTEPAPALRAHLLGRPVFERLLKFVIRQRIPRRDAEDVVQDSLNEAWTKRFSWGPTTEDLDKLLYRITRCNVLDAKKKWARSRLKMEKGDEQGADAGEGDGSGCSERDDRANDDDVDGDIPPVDLPSPVNASLVVQPAAIEQREELRLASDYIERHPKLHRAAGWMFRNFAGETFAEIAAKDGVTENAVATAVSKLRARMRDALATGFKVMLIAFFVSVLMKYGRHRPKDDMATPPPPKPVPTIVTPSPAPAPAPQANADDLRRRAFSECSAKQWHACLDDLDAAAQLDPEGDRAARVNETRLAAMQALERKK